MFWTGTEYAGPGLDFLKDFRSNSTLNIRDDNIAGPIQSGCLKEAVPSGLALAPSYEYDRYSCPNENRGGHGTFLSLFRRSQVGCSTLEPHFD